MSIYELTKKEMWNLLKSFARCEYGRIQFVLSYSLSFILFFIMIILFVMLLLVGSVFKKMIITFLFLTALLCLIAFIVGSVHYYTELRYFCYKLNKRDLR